MIRSLRESLCWLEEERKRLKEERERLETERDYFKAQLEKIYRSRGWKVLSFYYRIKHWVLVKLGVIKE